MDTKLGWEKDSKLGWKMDSKLGWENGHQIRIRKDTKLVRENWH